MPTGIEEIALYYFGSIAAFKILNAITGIGNGGNGDDDGDNSSCRPSSPIEHCSSAEGSIRPTNKCAYAINYNNWGNKNADLCIYHKQNYIGWKWDNPGGIIYPSIVVGSNFCAWTSTLNKFPIKWKDIDTWTVNIDWIYPRQPDGDWNLSFDIYFWDTNNCGADSHKRLNNMIWLQGGGGLFQPSKEETINVDGKDYWVDYPWGHWGGKWNRRNFVLQNGFSGNGSYTVDLKKILSSQDDINGDWTLDGVQFGNEAANSSGEINITKFDMELNGSRIHLYT